MIMHFSKLVFKKEIIIIEMNQLFCNRVKALKYAVEDVLLLCNGNMSKWSNYFARCVKIRNYRIGSLKHLYYLLYSCSQEQERRCSV